MRLQSQVDPRKRLTYAQKLCCGAAKRPFAYQVRYKTHSARKLLILLGSCHGRFFTQPSQVLDFSGLPGWREAAINKVIHMAGTRLVNTL